MPAKENDIDMPMVPISALNNIASGVTTIIPGIDPFMGKEVFLQKLQKYLSSLS